MNTDHVCDLNKLRELFDRGLCSGVGQADGQVCVEAAISLACDGVLKDEPTCVDATVRNFCISLNDKSWSTPQTRAAGMWDLALAQLGTKGVIDRKKFATKLAELTIRRVLPVALRAAKLEAAAKRCEEEGTRESALAGRKAADADAYAADAAASAAAYAAYAAAYAAYAASAAAAYADASAAAAYADAAADAAYADAAYAAYADAASAASAAYAASAAAAYADAAADAAYADAAADDDARSAARDRVLALSASCAAEAIKFAMPNANPEDIR